MDLDELALAARHELWRRGNLEWKLHATQKKIYKLIQSKRRIFLLCSRRLGKSFALVCVAFEHAIRNPGARISYAAPTQKDAAQIAGDLAEQILSDCPPDIKPLYHTADKEFRFPNGAIVRFSGVEAGHRENLRGRAAHLFICDEVGSWSDLSYCLRSIINPLTLTTKGKVIMASTPPRSPGHDMTKIVKEMDKRGEVATFTLLDAPHIDYDDKYATLEDCGEDPKLIPDILAGKAEPHTSTAQREYFCRDVTDTDSQVIPEFNAKAQAEIVRVHERPPYFDAYVSIDPGYVDGTGGLFSYWEFAAQKLVIEDEFLLKRANTDEIALIVKEKEEALWGGKPPFQRISDIDLRLISDLRQNHHLIFMPANRHDSDGAIDLIRRMVARRELVIDPKCLGLIRQLRNATFSKSGDFERTAEDLHFDLLAALKYLCRSIIRTKNPYPAWYAAPGFGTHSIGRAQNPKTVFTSTPLGRKFAKKWG